MRARAREFWTGVQLVGWVLRRVSGRDWFEMLWPLVVAAVFSWVAPLGTFFFAAVGGLVTGLEFAEAGINLVDRTPLNELPEHLL